MLQWYVMLCCIPWKCKPSAYILQWTINHHDLPAALDLISAKALYRFHFCTFLEVDWRRSQVMKGSFVNHEWVSSLCVSCTHFDNWETDRLEAIKGHLISTENTFMARSLWSQPEMEMEIEMEKILSLIREAERRWWASSSSSSSSSSIAIMEEVASVHNLLSKLIWNYHHP